MAYRYYGSQQYIPSSILNNGYSNIYNTYPSIYQNSNQTKIFMVSSIDEAFKYLIDFNSVLYVFINETDNQIYTKQFDVKSGYVVFKQFDITEPIQDSTIPTVELSTPSAEPIPIEDNTLHIQVENLETIVSSLKAELNMLKEKLN